MPQDNTQALRLLDDSLRWLNGILLAVLLQLRSLSLERLELLGKAAPGDGGEAQCLQLTASLLSVWALAGFYGQSTQLPDPLGENLSAGSLLLALMRLIRLTGTAADTPASSS